MARRTPPFPSQEYSSAFVAENVFRGYVMSADAPVALPTLLEITFAYLHIGKSILFE